MGQGGSLAPFSAAAAAEARAGACRLRLDDLGRPDHVIDREDVVRAHAHLAAATARAAAARLRLDTARRHHEVQQLLRRLHRSEAAEGVRVPDRVGALTLSPLRLKTFDWVSSGRVGLKPLWLGFVSLGGECGILEFDAYLHGAWEMGERDRSVLAQVCWEYETFGTL